LLGDPGIRVFEDAESLAAAAAASFAARAREAVKTRGRFLAALSGGSTPRRLYAILAEGREDVPWDRTWLVTGDERNVPPDHPDSNFGMIRSTLLSKVPVPASQVLRFVTEISTPEKTATAFEASLRADVPRFDLVLLGLGADGHTASLFPGSPALGACERLAVAVRVEKLDAWRLTLTLPTLNAGREIVFLVAGDDKAEALRRVLAGDLTAPAAHVRPVDGRLTFLVDRAAAARIP